MLREDPELAIRQKREIEKRDGAEDQSLPPSDLSVSSRPTSALRADPELPSLEMAWSLGHMQEFFNRRVLPLMRPGQQVTAVAIEDVTYRVGKQCEILYSLKFADLTQGQSRWVVVTFANENKLGEIYRHHYGGENGPVAGPTPRPVVFLPAYGCLSSSFLGIGNSLSWPGQWSPRKWRRSCPRVDLKPIVHVGSPRSRCSDTDSTRDA